MTDEVGETVRMNTGRIRSLLPGIPAVTSAAALSIATLLHTRTPEWHRANESLPGTVLTGWALIVGAGSALIAGLYTAVVLWRRQQLTRVTRGLAAAALAAGALWRMNHSADLELAKTQARASSALPGVWDMATGFQWVVWLSVAALLVVVLTAVPAPDLPRNLTPRWFVVVNAALVAGVVTLCGATASVPHHTGPQVVPAQDDPAAGGEPNGLGTSWVHVTVPSEDLNPGNAVPISAAVPLSNGFALTAGKVLAGYSADGKRLRWSDTFPERVSFIAGTDAIRGDHDPWLLVQTTGRTTPFLITYAIDASSGQIAWSSDAFATILQAVGTPNILRIGTQPTFAAITSATNTDDASADAADVDLLLIDARTGHTTTAHQYRNHECADPKRIAIYHSNDYSAVAVPETCGPAESKLQMYELPKGKPRETLTASALGGDQNATLALADSHGQALAITMTTGDTQTDRSVVYGPSLGGQTRLLPTGYIATALLGDTNTYTYTVAATDPQGHQAIIYTDTSTPKTLTIPTGLTTTTDRGLWAYTSTEVISAGDYTTAHPVENNSTATQIAPLTIVAIPKYPYAAPSERGTVSITTSPCRQGSQPHNQLFQAADALLLWCNSTTAASNEVFALS